MNNSVTSEFLASDTPLDDLDLLMGKAVATFGNESQIQHLEKSELALLQKMFNLGQTWGTIDLPENWRNPACGPGQGRLNLYNSLRKCSEDHELVELAVLTVMRLLFVLILSPSAFGGRRRLHPRTVLSFLKLSWMPIVKKAMTRWKANAPGLLCLVCQSDFEQEDKINEIRRLTNLTQGGYWSDCPGVGGEKFGSAEAPSSVIGKIGIVEEKIRKPFLPLPDVYVHIAGQRSAWIIEHLTVPILEAIEVILVEFRRPSHFNKYQECLGKGKHKRAIKCLKKLEWSLTSIPFELNLLKSVPPGRWGKKLDPQVAWPPQSMGDLHEFAALLQMANYFVIALSLGPRASEILSFTTASIGGCEFEPNDDELIEGKTYKNVTWLGGANRKWPLPRLAQKAASGQQKLVRLFAMLSDSNLSWDQAAKKSLPLWFCGGARDYATVLHDPNPNLRWFSRALMLDGYLDDVPFTNHRFRKTIARLIGIALAESPQILQDIFGHETLNETVSYIMTDPLIVADIKAARVATVKMMAKDAIRNVDELGGPAAHNVKQSIEILKTRAMSDFGAIDEDHLAIMLTVDGRTWMKPRDSVICTKGRNISGPCALGTSQVNTANCRPGCDHRLELPAGREQADGAISRCISKIREAQERDDFMLAEIWEVKLLENLERFSDIKEKWRLDPLVVAALEHQEKLCHD